MEKNKHTLGVKKNFLEKTAFLTPKIFKKPEITGKKNPLHLSYFGKISYTLPKIPLFLVEKWNPNQTFTRIRHGKRNFFLQDPEKKEICQNYLDPLYYKNESRHFFESFFKTKNKAKRVLLHAKKHLPKGLFICEGNFLFCQQFKYTIFRKHSIKFYLTGLFQRKWMYSKIYKHNTKIVSITCFYHKLKRYKKNYVAKSKKFTYFLENIKEKSVRSKAIFEVMFPCNNYFHRLQAYQNNSNPRNKNLLAPVDFLKITGKKYEPIGTRYLKMILAEEINNIYALRETFNKISFQESNKTKLVFQGNLKANFFLKFFVFELFEKIKKDKKNSLFFIGLIHRLFAVITRPIAGKTSNKNYYMHKKSQIFFEQIQWKEGQYGIEAKIGLYSNKKIDTKYKMSVFLIKKEEINILFNFTLEAVSKNIVHPNFYPYFYKIMNRLLNKFLDFPRGFYLEIACKCMEILKSNPLASTALFFFRVTLLKNRIDFFLHTTLTARLFFLIERAILFLAG